MSISSPVAALKIGNPTANNFSAAAYLPDTTLITNGARLLGRGVELLKSAAKYGSLYYIATGIRQAYGVGATHFLPLGLGAGAVAGLACGIFSPKNAPLPFSDKIAYRGDRWAMFQPLIKILDPALTSGIAAGVAALVHRLVTQRYLFGYQPHLLAAIGAKVGFDVGLQAGKFLRRAVDGDSLFPKGEAALYGAGVNSAAETVGATAGAAADATENVAGAAAGAAGDVFQGEGNAFVESNA